MINRNIDKLRKHESLAKYFAYGLDFSDHPAKKAASCASHRGYLSCLKEQGYDVVQSLAEELPSRGLHIYVAYSTTKNLPIQVICRGTDPNDSSIIADFDSKGPGYSSMVTCRKEIIEGLESAVKKSKCKDLEICGHSLGGAISQLLLWFITIERLKARGDSPLIKDLSSVHVSVFHSAHINSGLAKLVKDNIKKINGNKDSEKNLKIEYVAHQQKYDPINISGEHLLSDIDPEYANVKVVRSSLSLFQLLRSWLTFRLAAHNATFYFVQDSKTAFDPFKSPSEEDNKVLEKCKFFENTETAERYHIKKHLGYRFINLTRVFGVFYPLLKSISTPILQIVISALGLVQRFIAATFFIFCAAALPTVQSVALAINSVREFVGFMLDSINFYFNYIVKQPLTSVKLNSEAPDIVNSFCVKDPDSQLATLAPEKSKSTKF